MDELTFIGNAISNGLLGASFVLVPIFVYRKLRGLPFMLDSKPIDVASRKDRNMLMFNVVGMFGISAFCFGGQLPICGCGLALAGLYSIFSFEYLDRKLEGKQVHNENIQ